MSYRVDITVVCTETLYNDILKLARVCEYKPECRLVKENIHVLKFDWIKWGGDLNDCILSYLEDFEKEYEQKYSSKYNERDFAAYISFGEDNEIECNYYGSEESYDYYVELSVANI